jgi:hypothetical protein
MCICNIYSICSSTSLTAYPFLPLIPPHDCLPPALPRVALKQLNTDQLDKLDSEAGLALELAQLEVGA